MTEDPVRLLAQDDDALAASLLRSARDGDRDDARAHKALVLGAAGGAAVGGAALVGATKLTSRGFFSMFGAKLIVAAVVVAGGIGAATLWSAGERSPSSGAAPSEGDPAAAAPSEAPASAPAERADSPSKQAESNEPPPAEAPLAAEPPKLPASEAARAKDAIAPSPVVGADTASPASARNGKPISPEDPAPSDTAPKSSAAAAPAGSSGLAEEVEALRAAHDALGKGQPARCLEAVNAYFAAFPKGRLSAEARYLRVEALSASGKRAEAVALAKSMLAASPRSPYAARLRAISGDSP